MLKIKEKIIYFLFRNEGGSRKSFIRTLKKQRAYQAFFSLPFLCRYKVRISQAISALSRFLEERQRQPT